MENIDLKASILVQNLIAGCLGGAITFMLFCAYQSADAKDEILRVKELRIVGDTGKDQIILSSSKENGTSIEISDSEGNREIDLGVYEKSISLPETLSSLKFRSKKTSKCQMGLMTIGENDSNIILGDSPSASQITLSCSPDSQFMKSTLRVGSLSDGNFTVFTGDKVAMAYVNTILSRLELKNKEGEIPTITNKDNDGKFLKRVVFENP
jgi:hypothetical protein